MFIGAMPDATGTYEESVLKMDMEDKILLFTDCLNEAKNKSVESYSVKRLLGSVEKHINLKQQEFVDAILKDF